MNVLEPAARPGHTHRTHRSGWLRAAVLGANDGVLSISGLMLGVAAAHATQQGTLAAGLAGLIAGALSMGAGEYVSVSSQADVERADLDLERNALAEDFHGEHRELQQIYVRRGLNPELAKRVASELMAHDALGAHARDDIGITDALSAKPVQAALASAFSFTGGGVVPLLAAISAPRGLETLLIAIVSLTFLVALGSIAAHVGGASIARGAARVLIWGALTMATTSAVGHLFGALAL